MTGRVRVPKQRTCCSPCGDGEDDRNLQREAIRTTRRRTSGQRGRVSRASVPPRDQTPRELRQRDSVRESPVISATPLIHRVRDYAAVPRSGLIVRAVFFLENDNDDFVFGFLRATHSPPSVVVFANNGDILIPSQIRIVIRVSKIPERLHVKYNNVPSLHVVRDTRIDHNENRIVRLRSRAVPEGNQEEYRAKVSLLGIPWASVAFLVTTQQRSSIILVDLENPWEALR